MGVKTMSDIVERLRLQNDCLLGTGHDFSDVLLDAADEIEWLRELLREGLRPWPLAVSDGDGSNMRSWRDDWERRVREALGND